MPMIGVIKELDDIANGIDDFRCFFETNTDNVTDEDELAKDYVRRLDLLIEFLKETEIDKK